MGTRGAAPYHLALFILIGLYTGRRRKRSFRCDGPAWTCPRLDRFPPTRRRGDEEAARAVPHP